MTFKFNTSKFYSLTLNHLFNWKIFLYSFKNSYKEKVYLLYIVY